MTRMLNIGTGQKVDSENKITQLTSLPNTYSVFPPEKHLNEIETTTARYFTAFECAEINKCCLSVNALSSKLIAWICIFQIFQPLYDHLLGVCLVISAHQKSQ